MDNENRKPSEVLQEFLNLLEKSNEEYRSAQELIEQYNSKTYEQTHLLEDCEDDDLYKFAYDWRTDLLARRQECDRKALYDAIHKFSISEQNKPTLKRLKAVLASQKQTEEYLEIPYGNREFKGGSARCMTNMELRKNLVSTTS